MQFDLQSFRNLAFVLQDDLSFVFGQIYIVVVVLNIEVQYQEGVHCWVKLRVDIFEHFPQLLRHVHRSLV